MKLCPKISRDAGRNRATFIAVVLVFCGHALASEHCEKGYLYLSPIPGAEYVLPQTKFFLALFDVTLTLLLFLLSVTENTIAKV